MTRSANGVELKVVEAGEVGGTGTKETETAEGLRGAESGREPVAARMRPQLMKNEDVISRSGSESRKRAYFASSP